jgi:two-component system response regulator DevR
VSDQTTIRVFLVDDHPLVRDGVRSALEASGGLEVVGEAGTVEEALARVPAAAPDVAIVDLHLPDGSGVEICRTLAAGEPLIDERSRQQIHARIKQGTSDPRLSQLSPQEMALLEHLTEGLTNREISRRMHLSEKTVKNYMSNLLLKLGMERRTEAAVYGSRALERRDAARRQAERLPSAIRY